MPELIPAAALDSHIGILGKTGSGKSNLAKVIAELQMQRGERVCIVDPTGTWWGLRLWPDGKPSKFKPVIFGGEHADIEITEQHGAVIAEAIGTSSDSAIIDTRLMGSNARTRFFTAFAEALLRTNKGPLTLIIDEAHLFAPQGKVNSPEAGKMLAEANELVSRGRSAGLRMILITQRPAKLHKDSLTQVETLIAMRLIAPQDRRAVEDWVGEWADAAKGKEIIGSLPSLPVGDAWIWAPQLDHLKRVHFPLAATFDSGKALSRDEAAPTLTAIDAAKLGGKMDAIRQEAAANDPKRLKARITELEKAGEARSAFTIDDSNPTVKLLVDSARQEGRVQGYAEGAAAAMMEAKRKVLAFAGELAAGDAKAPDLPERPSRPTPILPRAAVAAAPSKPVEKITTSGEFTGPQMKIIRALSMWAALGHTEPTKIMVAVVAGYSPTSGGLANLLGQLRGAGAIDYPMPSHVRLLAGAAPMSSNEGRDMLLGTLSNPQRKLFDALTHGEMSKNELAEATEYSPTSGGFANLLGQLRSMGIAEYPQAGRVALAPWVFEVL